MTKLLISLLLACVGFSASIGYSNAGPLTDADCAYNLTALTKAFSLLQRLVVRVNFESKYIPELVVGRNKYGYPVPDPVMTAHEGKLRPGFLKARFHRLQG